MSLLATVCNEMGLQHINISSLADSKIFPETWTEFMSMDEANCKKCKDTILKQLNLDKNTVNRIWFNMHYLGLYHHFNIKDNIRIDINDKLLTAFTELLSRHPAIIKDAMFLIRLEWSDIATAINAKQKTKRPQSPWGQIPSLSLPADPSAFVGYIWPNIPFKLEIPQNVNQYLKNASDKITVVYLKTLDLAAIAMFGLSRNDELDQWFIRYYQKYGDHISLDDNKQDLDTEVKYCNLKTCSSFHRTCLLMHLHGKWTENLMMKEKLTHKAHDEDSKMDDVSDEKGIRLQKHVANYLGADYDSEVAFNDIYHIQHKHIDFWMTMNEKRVLKKRLSQCADIDEHELLQEDNERDEILLRYQDIRLFCDGLNETRASFCGEFLCGLLGSNDIEQIEKDLQAIREDNMKMKHPTMLLQHDKSKSMSSGSKDYNDLNHLCTNLHKNIFHGYSLFHSLKKYKAIAFKMNPNRLRKQEAAVRLALQNKLRAQIQAKMRQTTI